MAGGKVPPFREDFFERIIDVQWEVEPKVYWMVGTGTPMIINGMAMGFNHASMWTSDDGKNWQGPTDLHVPGSHGFGAIYTGCWMRSGLVEAGPPVWVMGGGTDHGIMYSCMGSSTDGKTFGNRKLFDKWHVCENLQQEGQTGVAVLGKPTNLSQHIDFFRSSDGQSWEPERAHPEDFDPEDAGEGGSGGGGGLLRAATASPMSATPAEIALLENSVVYKHVGPEPAPTSLLVPDKSLLVPERASLLGPSLREDIAQEVADKILFIGSSTKASGKVKVGKHRGKVLEIEIKPFKTKAPAHGGPTVVLKNKKTGKSVGKANTGVEKSIRIGYGHYVFVVGGENHNVAVVSYSENGMDWKLVELGEQAQVNAICVGPRK